MRCPSHDKEFIGLCTWCGKQLCEMCVGRQEGRKLYCSSCSQNIAKIPKRILPAEPKKGKGTGMIEINGDEEPKVELWY